MVVAALVAVTVAMAVATLTGAQRTESALDRLREQSHSSDLLFFFDEDALTSNIEALAEVEAIVEVGLTSEMFLRPVGSELFPDFQMLAIAPRPDLGGGELDVPRIVEGRAIRPDAVDEIALSEVFAEELDIHVGDTIELESMTDEWIDVAFTGGDPGAPDGPVVSVEVVGLARTPADFGRFAGHLVHLSPAFAARFEDEMRTYTITTARIVDDSPEALQALESGSLGALDASEVDISFFSDSVATQDGLRTIAVSLRLVALAAILAGLAAIGLALARLARDTMSVRVTLAAIGWTRAQLVLLVTILLAPWVIVGVGVGMALGAIGSPLALVGLARRVDPDVDALAPYPGWIALVGLGSIVVLSGLLGLAVWRAARSSQGSAPAGRALPRLTHPLAVPIGVRRALFGASDSGGRASRGALVAMAASVTVAVAALLVGTSIQRLQDDPVLSGQGPLDQRLVDSGESAEVFEQALAVLEDDDRVADLVGFHVGFGVSAPGAGEMSVLVFDVRRGELGNAILSGRNPVQRDEIAVGPETLDELGLDVGKDVQLTSEQGDARFRIVGTTLFPEGDFRHDAGIAMNVEAADALLGGVAGTDIHQVAFRWADGVDEVAADRSLADEGLRIFSTEEGLRPPSISNLDEVRDLPLLLAALVLVLGLVTLLHAVVVTTRRRDREAGTLRALGVTPRALVALVETQATVAACIAVLAGLPLGVALGRQIWSPIAERAHVVDQPIPAWTGMAWVAMAVLAGAAVLALPIASRALRQRPADALRAE